MVIGKDDIEDLAANQDDFIPVEELIEEESSDSLKHKKEIRKLLYKRMEMKRLRQEIEDLEDDFEWED